MMIVVKAMEMAMLTVMMRMRMRLLMMVMLTMVMRRLGYRHYYFPQSITAVFDAGVPNLNFIQQFLLAALSWRECLPH